MIFIGSAVYIENISADEKENQNGIKKNVISRFLEFSGIKDWVKSHPPKAELEWQKNADKQRVEDLNNLANLVKSFHEKTGYYPLAKSDIPFPIYIDLTSKKYESDVTHVDMKHFVDEIKSVLGSDVTVPVDPQKYDAWGGARLYQYFTDGIDYGLYTFLFFERDNTEQIEPFFMINSKTAVYINAQRVGVNHIDHHGPKRIQSILRQFCQHQGEAVLTALAAVNACIA